jgi:TPR repeat protein
MNVEHTDTQTAVSASEKVAKTQHSKLRVFISYSRDDLDFADQLDAALRLIGFDTSVDRHAVSGGEEWRQRLGSLIREADTVVFVLSPSSAGSAICAWEVEEAVRTGKRIIPAVPRSIAEANPPQQLRDLNYIFFYAEPKSPGSGFGSGLTQLVEALNTDLEWLREHTRLFLRATEWDSGGRPENRLLSGSDILAAKAWAAKRPRGAPEPTALHLEFIRMSEQAEDARLNAQRKQLEAMAQAQAEREAALHQAEEALKQAADAQLRRARIRNVALVVVSVLLVATGWLWWRAEQQRLLAEQQRSFAEQQRVLAEEQRNAAEDILNNSTNIIVSLQTHLDDNNKKSVFAVFARGAAQGNLMAMYNLGVNYANGIGVAQDYAKAREWYEKAAALGHASAMYNLALLYEKALGVPQDYAKARELYERAVAAGNTDAMVNLGFFYENAQGVAQDHAKAREWYEKAAAANDAMGMYNLGQLYEKAQGVPQDYVKAREWYEKAAAASDASAMYNLAQLYEKARGVPQDYAKAREWYEKAAAFGHASAMYNLALLYEKALGVPQDFPKAREWYEKAAAGGDGTARRRLELLPIVEAESAGDYAKALRLRESLAEKREETEAKRDGKPGKETAVELMSVAWYALLARDFPKALVVSERAHTLDPENLVIETNRAHALMFLGREREASTLYLGYKGKRVSEQDNETWDQVVDEDFREFGKIGLNNPLIAKIEKELDAGH